MSAAGILDVAKGLALFAQYMLHLEHGSINSLLRDANLHTLNTDHTPCQLF